MSAERRSVMRREAYMAAAIPLAAQRRRSHRCGRSVRRASAPAQPRHRGGDPLLHAYPRPPAQQSIRLLDRWPTALYVHVERGQVLERELVRILATGLPDDAGDLRDRELS